MIRGCRITFLGEPRGPWRTNLDDARQDAIRLKLGGYDEWGRFFLDGGADITWGAIEQRAAA